MKKIFLLIATAIALFFSTSANAAKEPVTDAEKIQHIITDYYPNLKSYYDAGVMSIVFLNEETLGDGSTEYNIRYKFSNEYYQESEIAGLLEREYPNEFILYKAGLLKDVSAFKYVDKETGNIETHLSYNWKFPVRRRPMRHMHR